VLFNRFLSSQKPILSTVEKMAGTDEDDDHNERSGSESSEDETGTDDDHSKCSSSESSDDETEDSDKKDKILEKKDVIEEMEGLFGKSCYQTVLDNFLQRHPFGYMKRIPYRDSGDLALIARMNSAEFLPDREVILILSRLGKEELNKTNNVSTVSECYACVRV
jgi:hypothetical protein